MVQRSHLGLAWPVYQLSTPCNEPTPTSWLPARGSEGQQLGRGVAALSAQGLSWLLSECLTWG